MFDFAVTEGRDHDRNRIFGDGGNSGGHIKIIIDGNTAPGIDKPFDAYFGDYEKSKDIHSENHIFGLDYLRLK